MYIRQHVSYLGMKIQEGMEYLVELIERIDQLGVGTREEGQR